MLSLAVQGFQGYGSLSPHKVAQKAIPQRKEMRASMLLLPSCCRASRKKQSAMNQSKKSTPKVRYMKRMVRSGL